MTNKIPSISVNYACNGRSVKSNKMRMGMREMQERAYAKRGEQYLLIKSPPASGKSRALMFIALDKLHNQDIKKAIIAVPERSIGASFNNEALSESGFWANWEVSPHCNLCNAPGNNNGGKVKALQTFLTSDERILVCTHATLRFAVDRLGVEAFDNCMIAIDEFHHVSSNTASILGGQLRELMDRDKVHIVAMTGSYFRGDAEAILRPDDEAKFETVTYTYYEQLNGYQYLKQLDIGYYFYPGSYLDQIIDVLDPKLKTIVYIPNVNSRESSKDKTTEVSEIMGVLGKWQGKDEETGFNLVQQPNGNVLKIADLVDDLPDRHSKVLMALKDPAQKHNKDHVDIIIALGMAKEGFDWIWCEHTLTVGYRSSLTEIIQIIGRATRDAKGKVQTRFTNLIAEPDATEKDVADAINDTLKAIAASLLMEQVLAPKFSFKPKNPESDATQGFDYGEGGYDPDKVNVGYNSKTGQVQVEIKGLKKPKSAEAQKICGEDLKEVIAAFVQDKQAKERGMFDEDLIPQELTITKMGKILKEKYPGLEDEDREAVRQHAVAAMNLTQQGNSMLVGGGEGQDRRNTDLIDGIRKYAIDVKELDIDLIDSINPFREAYSILAKTMDEKNLERIAQAFTGKRVNLTLDEARGLTERAIEFRKRRGRNPESTSQDGWEKRMAEGIAFLRKIAEETDDDR